MVENESNLKVKCLQSDNCGEYEDDEFKKYCAQDEIKKKKIILGTLQHNDIADMMNKTMNERAKRMRLNSGLPISF